MTRGQLDRLRTVIGVPNIWFGILPFGVPLPIASQNSFQLHDSVAIVGETTHTGDEADAYIRATPNLPSTSSPETPADVSSSKQRKRYPAQLRRRRRRDFLDHTVERVMEIPDGNEEFPACRDFRPCLCAPDRAEGEPCRR